MWHVDQDISSAFQSHITTVLPYCDPSRQAWVARAPGRLDVMGGIADYSGSLVLQMPLDVAAVVAVQMRSDDAIVVTSLADSALLGQATVTYSLATLRALAGDWHGLRTYFGAHTHNAWASYIAGVIPALWHHSDWDIATGMTIIVDSSVPLGKGVSSSAAIEVATMRACLAVADMHIPGRTLALWSQFVENMIVGAPCGIMDQMTSACGLANRLMALRCQPAELLGHVAIPDDLMVWGIDSGVRHAVSGADYGSVRVGAFMGYRMLAAAVGLPVTPAGERVDIIDTHWHGYLANLTPSAFMQMFADVLPEQISGAEFLHQYVGLTDTVTRVDPERTYAVRQPTMHPIWEHHRVQLFAQLLSQSPISDTTADLLGELMYQSHASYSACGLGSAATDRIVAEVRQHGAAMGLFGAKITGGGSGGTVAVLGRPSAEAQVRDIAQRLGSGVVFAGSSDGAAASAVVLCSPV